MQIGINLISKCKYVKTNKDGSLSSIHHPFCGGFSLFRYWLMSWLFTSVPLKHQWMLALVLPFTRCLICLHLFNHPFDHSWNHWLMYISCISQGTRRCYSHPPGRPRKYYHADLARCLTTREGTLFPCLNASSNIVKYCQILSIMVTHLGGQINIIMQIQPDIHTMTYRERFPCRWMLCQIIKPSWIYFWSSWLFFGQQ